MASFQRMGSDGRLYSPPHRPGDDNYNNPLTNVDFRVTPPVRSASFSAGASPRGVAYRRDSYFDSHYLSDMPEDDAPTTSVCHSSVPVSIRTPSTELNSATAGKMGKVVRAFSNDTDQHLGRAAQGESSHLNGKTHEGNSLTSTEEKTGADAGKEEEKAFGTNLTTGRREYLSQYRHPKDRTAKDVANLASSPDQDETLSNETDTTTTTSSTFTSTTADWDTPTQGTPISESVDIY